MKNITSYISTEYIKLHKQATILATPFIFNILYFYAFYHSFNTTYPNWKYEFPALEKFTYWCLKVTDIASVTITISVLIVVFYLITVDLNHWNVFQFLPVNLSKIHLSKVLLGIILVITIQTCIFFFEYIEFLISLNTLFEKGSWDRLFYKLSYVEVVTFFIFGYSSCFLLKSNTSLWILFMVILIFIRNILPILPLSSLYFSYSQRNAFWSNISFPIVSVGLFFLTIFKRQNG
ncbi:hypothetical protein [Runella sp.]|uniref:hypothetical protein n=1 Tax=Runella sp. TaxID=1960881 RepID=UPI003D123C68